MLARTELVVLYRSLVNDSPRQVEQSRQGSELVVGDKWSLCVMACRIGWDELSLPGREGPVIVMRSWVVRAVGGRLGLVRG